jgi:hypothetical protein
MQPESPKREIERERKAFGHVPLAGKRSEGVVADVSAVERAADDFREVDHARDQAVLVAHDEEADVARRRGRRMIALDVRGECRRRFRCMHPAAVQVAALPGLRNERPLIASPRQSQVDPVAFERGRVLAHWHNRHFIESEKLD